MGQTVSLVIIALNEEKNVAEAINKHQKHFDDVLVALDERTTDNTRQLAHDSGARVRAFGWEYSFSKFRNDAAFSAYCNWIFMLDCDETLSKELLDNLRPMINDERYHGYLFPRRNLYTDPPENYPDLQLRLYCKGYQWRGRVHEVIDKDIPQKLIFETKFEIIHHKKWKTPETIALKNEQYQYLLSLDEKDES